MNKIDFVIPWVDDSDANWIEEKNKFMSNQSASKDFKAMVADKAFRDWNILKYWFRSVEKYAPWVNKIYFVTYGHLPEWLNTSHEKIVIINHVDYLPKDALPTFNSRAIEINFHRIKNISDQFVYFNDDFFLNDYVKEEDFFEEGLPKDSAIMSPIVPIRYGTSNIQVNDMEIINNYFKKNEAIKMNFTKWFSFFYGKKLFRNIMFFPSKQFIGFFEPHIPVSYLRKSFEELWDKEERILLETTYSRFKHKTNINQWLFRYWQIASGNFVPRRTNFGQYYELSEDNRKLFEDINKSKHKVICINDTFKEIDYKKTQKELITIFEKKFPKKSLFEKEV